MKSSVCARARLRCGGGSPVGRADGVSAALRSSETQRSAYSSFRIWVPRVSRVSDSGRRDLTDIGITVQHM